MAFPTYIHDPDAVLDYPLDWSAWLPEGDILTDIDVITADGAELVGLPTITDAVTVAWLRLTAAAVQNRGYNATYRVTTAAGRIDDRTITLKCKER